MHKLFFGIVGVMLSVHVSAKTLDEAIEFVVTGGDPAFIAGWRGGAELNVHGCRFELWTNLNIEKLMRVKIIDFDKVNWTSMQLQKSINDNKRSLKFSLRCLESCGVSGPYLDKTDRVELKFNPNRISKKRMKKALDFIKTKCPGKNSNF